MGGGRRDGGRWGNRRIQRIASNQHEPRPAPFRIPEEEQAKLKQLEEELARRPTRAGPYASRLTRGQRQSSGDRLLEPTLSAVSPPAPLPALASTNLANFSALSSASSILSQDGESADGAAQRLRQQSLRCSARVAVVAGAHLSRVCGGGRRRSGKAQP